MARNKVFNVFEGSTPKRDAKVMNEIIKSETLKFLRDIEPYKFKTVEELRDLIKNDVEWLNRISVINYLANEHGFKGKITSAINVLRLQDHPIISSVSHKGYIYQTIDNPDMPENWDSIFSANEVRKDIPVKEKITLEKLFTKQYEMIKKLNKPELLQELKVIARRHGIKVEEDSD